MHTARAFCGGAFPELPVTTSLFSAAVNLAGLIGVSAATLLTALILRNPFLPRWLQNEATAHAASLVLTAGAFFAVMNAATGLAESNIHYGIISIIVAGVAAGSTYALWKAFDIGERLARADAGQSPFAHRQKVPVTPATALGPATVGG